MSFTAANGAQTLLMLGTTTLLMNSPAVAQDGVFRHIDPGVNGRNGAFVPDDTVKVVANIPDLFHFVSDRQTVHMRTTVFLYGINERIDIFVDLVGASET